MSKVFDFINACGHFFVLTIDNGCPVGRPFGAIMEYNDQLYISTSDTKAVYRQLKEHPQVQLLALKAGTRSWARISGTAYECTDLMIKQMLASCPALSKHFSSPNAPHYCVFAIRISKSELYD